MEQRNRMIIAVVIALVIVAAVISSFGLPILTSNTPKLVLPDVSEPVDSGGSPEGSPGLENHNYIPIEVTADTVQSVIATLSRPASYYRELTVETMWGDGLDEKGTTSVKVWTDGKFVKSEALRPGGLTQHTLVTGSALYLWYDGDTTWYERPYDDKSADLVAQNIPTYEDVLALDKTAITKTGYDLLNKLACIYVEVKEGSLGYLQRYWIGVESGLLVSAETVKGDEVVYRMQSGTLEVPIPEGVEFSLPDGTVLYHNARP